MVKQYALSAQRVVKGEWWLVLSYKGPRRLYICLFVAVPCSTRCREEYCTCWTNCLPAGCVIIG